MKEQSYGFIRKTVLSYVKAFMKVFCRSQNEQCGGIGQHGFMRNVEIKIAVRFRSQNGDAEPAADVKLADRFIKPVRRERYLENRMLIVKLYIIENVI